MISDADKLHFLEISKCNNNNDYKKLYFEKDIDIKLEKRNRESIWLKQHIDHVKPVSSFDKETPVNVVCSLENLQPLWSTTRVIDGVVYEGNLNKSNKI